MPTKRKGMCAGWNQEKKFQVEGKVRQIASGRVPPEVWVKIFALARSPNLSQLRLVCKKWQAIIDENFEKIVEINDDRMDVTSIFKLKKVTHCSVTKFVRTNPPRQLFMQPEFVSSLHLNGSAITKENFIIIAKQCNKVKELTLSGSLLIRDSNLFEIKDSQRQSQVLSKFMAGLQKLAVNGLNINDQGDELSSINLNSLLKWRMDQLKTLDIQAIRVNLLIVRPEHGLYNTNRDNQFFQLLEKFRALEHIEFNVKSVHVPIHIVPNPFVLTNLSTLNVELRVPARLPVWITFIRAQNSIKDLKLVTTHGEFILHRRLVVAILNNATSLKSLQLRSFTLSDNEVVAHLFRGLSNLASLIVQGCHTENLNNLELLPDSLKVLVIENFRCNLKKLACIKTQGVKVSLKNVLFT